MVQITLKILKKSLSIFLIGYIIRYGLIILKDIDFINIKLEYLYINYFAFISFFTSLALLFDKSFKAFIKYIFLEVYKCILSLFNTEEIKFKLGNNDKDLDISNNNVKRYINCMDSNSSGSSSSSSSDNLTSNEEMPHNNRVEDDHGHFHTLYTNYTDKLNRYNHWIEVLRVYSICSEHDLGTLGPTIASLPIDLTDYDIKGIIKYNIDLLKLARDARKETLEMNYKLIGLASLLNSYGNSVNNMHTAFSHISIPELLRGPYARWLNPNRFIVNRFTEDNVRDSFQFLIGWRNITVNRTVRNNIIRLTDSILVDLRYTFGHYNDSLASYYQVYSHSTWNNTHPSYTPFVISPETRIFIEESIDERAIRIVNESTIRFHDLYSITGRGAIINGRLAIERLEAIQVRLPATRRYVAQGYTTLIQSVSSPSSNRIGNIGLDQTSGNYIEYRV